MAVARFCSAGVAMRYVLPVLRMTSCLHTMAGVGELKNKIIEIKIKVTQRGQHGFDTAAYTRLHLAIMCVDNLHRVVKIGREVLDIYRVDQKSKLSYCDRYFKG